MSISVGSVAVDVVPDTKGFATDLKAKLKGVTANIGITGDTTRLKVALDKATKNRVAVIRAKADTSLATASLDAAAHDRTATIKANTSGLSQAQRGMSGLALAAITLGPALVPVTAAVAGLGLALGAPIAATGLGLGVAGFITGAAIHQTNKQQKAIAELAKKVTAAKAALATTGTSVSASSSNSSAAAQRSAAISIASAQRSAATSIASAQRAAATATTAAGRASAQRRIEAAKATLAAREQTIQASLSSRQAGISASADARQSAAQAKVTAAVAAYNAALHKLTPEQQKFIASKAALKDSFKSLVTVAGPAVFGPVVKGMDLLAGVLPKLKPLLTGVSSGVGTLEDDLGAAVKGPGFKGFMTAFGENARSAIVGFGHIFGDFAKGIFGVFKAFGPLSRDFMLGLTGISKGFADWGAGVGKTKGFRDFLAYVREVGPKVFSTLGSVAGAFVHIGAALAPIGGVVLTGLKGFSDVVRKIPTPILTALAAALVSTLAAVKGYTLFTKASKALDMFAASATKSRFIPGEFTKTQVAIRGLAGAAGIGLLTASATTSNKALGVLGNIGGGAMLGFSVGGPIGAAIGGGAGALLGLFENTKKSTKAFHDAIPKVDDYADSLNALTGAVTKQTRKNALDSLVKTGAITASEKVGLSARTMVAAALGNAKAQHQVNLALDQQFAKVTRLQKISPTASNAQFSKQHQAAEQAMRDFNTLSAAVGQNSKAFKDAQDKQRLYREVLGDTSKALKGFPRGVVTKVNLDGYPTTVKQISTLANKYDLTPKQVKTLVQLGNVNASLLDIARVVSAVRGIPPTKRVKVIVDVAMGRVAAAAHAGTVQAALGDLRGTPVGATGAIVNRPTLAVIGEAGPEAVVPLNRTHGNSPLPGGPQFVVEKVVAQDVNDFLRQMQTRARHASMDGIRR